MVVNSVVAVLLAIVSFARPCSAMFILKPLHLLRLVGIARHAASNLVAEIGSFVLVCSRQWLQW